MESRTLGFNTDMLTDLAVVLMESGYRNYSPRQWYGEVLHVCTEHHFLMDREILMQGLHVGQAVRNLQYFLQLRRVAGTTS